MEDGRGSQSNSGGVEAGGGGVRGGRPTPVSCRGRYRGTLRRQGTSVPKGPSTRKKASGEVTRSSDPAWPDEGKLGFQMTVLIREETLLKRAEYLLYF